MWKIEMERSWRKFLFLAFLGSCFIFGELVNAEETSHYSFHYPVLNDLVAKATSQVSPVSYVSKNGLVHLRMRPVFAFLPSVKNMGYSVWGHMQRVGHNFHKAMLSGFPIAHGPNIAASSTYDSQIGSNNVSPIKSAWSRIKCFPFGTKCHQQGYNDNYNTNDNYNNYNNNYRSNDNFINYNSNYKSNANFNNYNNYKSNDNFNSYNDNYKSNDNFNNYNDNYKSNDNFNNYNNNYQYN